MSQNMLSFSVVSSMTYGVCQASDNETKPSLSNSSKLNVTCLENWSDFLNHSQSKLKELAFHIDQNYFRGAGLLLYKKSLEKGEQGFSLLHSSIKEYPKITAVISTALTVMGAAGVLYLRNERNRERVGALLQSGLKEVVGGVLTLEEYDVENVVDRDSRNPAGKLWVELSAFAKLLEEDLEDNKSLVKDILEESEVLYTFFKENGRFFIETGEAKLQVGAGLFRVLQKLYSSLPNK